jgi:hypothetical protein
MEEALVVDFDDEGKPLGVEMTASSVVTLAAINRVLRGLGLSRFSRGVFEPRALRPDALRRGRNVLDHETVRRTARGVGVLAPRARR